MILVRDVTKAYIQSKPTERLVYYQPPKEFFEIHPDKSGYIWRANIQIYGDMEAGKYWHKPFVPCLCENVWEYQQEMYDPSLLFSPSPSAATALCTDDAMNLIPRSKRHEEAKMVTRFIYRNAQESPTKFKGLDHIQEGSQVHISRAAYSSKLKVDSTVQTLPKPELNRVMTETEMSELLSDAGKLAWLSTGTSTLSSFQVSFALQKNPHRTTPLLKTLLDTRKSLTSAKYVHHSQVQYIPLHEQTIHISLYSDGSFQNLDTKHSKIGFIIGIGDKSDNFNLVHLHSSRASRRPCSTEQSELMALDVGFRSLENIAKILFDLLKKEKFLSSHMLTARRFGPIS